MCERERERERGEQRGSLLGLFGCRMTHRWGLLETTALSRRRLAPLTKSWRNGANAEKRSYRCSGIGAGNKRALFNTCLTVFLSHISGDVSAKKSSVSKAVGPTKM